jgi:hypothetical protein
MFGIDPLTSGGLEEAGEDTMSFQATAGTIAEEDFAKDDHGAEGLFGMVMGGRDPRMS